MAGLIAPSAAVNLWGLIELGALAHAASLAPFAAFGGVEHSREEALNMLKGAPNPYKKFLDMARAANAGRIRLPEPWESLRMLVRPTAEERGELARNRAYDKFRGNERMKKALFYAVLALEEALGIYRAASRCAGRLEESVQKEEVGEGPLRWAMYVADLKGLERLAKEEEKALDDALRTLRERLNEYAVKYDLRDLLDVKEDAARELAEAERTALPKFSGSNFGVKAYAALLAYREHALGRRGAYGTAARYWIEEGGSVWLLYYVPITAYNKAKRIKAEGAAAVEGMIAEALRRLFLKPGADYYSRFVDMLTKGGGLALMLEGETKTSLVFKLFKLEEGSNPVELEGIRLRIGGIREGASRTYILELDTSWRKFFEHELKIVEETAGRLRDRWPIEDPLPYMLGWSASDVSIHGERGARELYMTSSHLWQIAETKVLFGWSDAVRLHMNLTLEGPRLQLLVHAPLGNLDGAVGRSAEGGWLSKLGVEAKSCDELKRWAVESWRDVVEAAVRHLGGDVQEELNALRDKLNDDKVAREAIAPALLLMQAERLGGDEEAYKDALRYFAMVISGAIGGDGYVSAAGRGEVGLTSGERAIALLWRAALAAYGIKAEVVDAGRGFNVVASGDGAVRLARLYLLYGPPWLEKDERNANHRQDDRLMSHRLAETVELGARTTLNINWKGFRRTKSGHVAADLTISEGDVDVKYNVYLRNDILLEFGSTDRSRAELAARLLRLAGVSAEVKGKNDEGAWYVWATTDSLAAGRKELRDAIAEIVRKAVENGWVDAGKAGRWLEKLERGLTLKEGWPRYLVRLVEGALEVKYRSTNPDNIEREARRLRDMGLVEGRHFTVKRPDGGGEGYVSIRREGLERAAWLSIRGSEEQRRLAAEFVGYILRRAGEEGREVYEKAEEVVDRGKEVGSLRLAGFKKEVDGRLVKVIGGGAEPEEGRGGRALLRIAITAEVDGIRGDYTMTFGRYGRNNAAMGYAYISTKAPDSGKVYAGRFAALIKALTGEEPKVYEREDGIIVIKCGGGCLEGLARYAELADAIMKWLEETGRR